MQRRKSSGQAAARARSDVVDWPALMRWFAGRARQADRFDRLERLLRQATSEIGAKFFALVQHGAIAGPQAVAVALSNYPEDWQRRFGEGELHRIDPVQQACGRSLTGFRWSQLETLVPLSEPQRELLRASRRHGIGAGVTVPLHLPGARGASCSFAVEPGNKLPEDALLAARLLGPLAFEAALRLLGGPGRRPIRLSPRERQCIALLATGLTDRGIANQLRLSEETVTKYLNAARRRHGLSRRAQLVAAALRDGEIGFEDIDCGMAP